ncbi:MAG: cupin domain-containing protein [Armatimonadota bacterium]|nr:cupin domain-containing protein [Armatimonadota bacterium]
MERVNESDCEFRHGDHGPKYLMRGPHIDWGVIVFKPGQEMGAHAHNQVEETFFFLEGTPLMVVDDQQFRVAPGDAFRLEPPEAHNIINDTDQDTRLVFIKTPYLPDDKVDVP